MGKPAARLGDIASNHGPWPPTPILMGSGTVLINGLPAARKGDMVLLHVIPNNPPHGRAINAGASKVKIDGIPAARVDDAISCGGKVAAGSGNVLIGDSPGKASPTKVNIPDITFPSQSGKIVKGTSPEPISTTPMATIEGQKFTETGHVNDTEVHVEAGHIHAADEELYTVEDGAVATLNYLAEGNNMIEALGSAASLIQNPEALVASLAAAAVSVAALPAGEQGEAASSALSNHLVKAGIGDKKDYIRANNLTTRDAVELLSAEDREKINKVSTFTPKGVTTEEATLFLLSTETGEKLLTTMAQASPGTGEATIFQRALGYIQSGVDVPEAILCKSELVKITPKESGVSPYSPYFTTHEELDKALSSGRSLQDYFGLPAASDSESYDIHTISPINEALVYTSVIAPTEELDGLFQTSGGGVQFIIPDRKLFTSPELIGSI